MLARPYFLAVPDFVFKSFQIVMSSSAFLILVFFPHRRYCFRSNRFMKEGQWLLREIAVSSCGSIVVSGVNNTTYWTSIDVYSFADSRERPKILYSKEFERYESEGRSYRTRLSSFVGSDDQTLVSCVGNKIEVFQVSTGEVIRFRKVNGSARSMSVRGNELLIGFFNSNKIIVYDVVGLDIIKSITLEGIKDGYWPYDMAAISGRIFFCEGRPTPQGIERSLIYEDKNGTLLSELAKPSDEAWYVNTLTVCTSLDLVAVSWLDSFRRLPEVHNQIVFYSLLSKSPSSFLIIDVESDVSRIRISERGDKLVTGNQRTWEVKVYDLVSMQ